MFIIDGIITIPLALLAFIFLPNLPQSGVKTWWITEREHELSIKRMASVGRAGKQEWTKAKARKILLSWHTYLLRESLFPHSVDFNQKRKDELTAKSLDLHPLEQRKHPERHWLLAEELQRQPSPRTRHNVHCYTDQPM